MCIGRGVGVGGVLITRGKESSLGSTREGMCEEAAAARKRNSPSSNDNNNNNIFNTTTQRITRHWCRTLLKENVG